MKVKKTELMDVSNAWALPPQTELLRRRPALPCNPYCMRLVPLRPFIRSGYNIPAEATIARAALWNGRQQGLPACYPAPVAAIPIKPRSDLPLMRRVAFYTRHKTVNRAIPIEGLHTSSCREDIRAAHRATAFLRCALPHAKRVCAFTTGAGWPRARLAARSMFC